MTAAERPIGPAGAVRRLCLSSPWVAISITVHAVIIAIASIVYFARGAVADDGEAAQIAFVPPREDLVEPPPPQVIDRAVPELREVGLEFTSDPVLVDEPVGSTTTDDADRGGVDDGRGTDDFTASTAIGLHGPGRFGRAPSSIPGQSRPGHHRVPGGKGGPEHPDQNERVRRALMWLRRHQDDDGHWDAANFMKHDASGEPCDGPGNPVNDVGVTGLAVMAFCGSGTTLRIGPHRDVVRKAVRWLADQQREDGLIGMPSSQEFMYSHAIATLALCEAYGLSAGPRPLRGNAQNAINYIAQARSPYGVWRYQPRDNDGDTSITGWMVQAMLSAKEFGLQVDENALRAARVWFDNVTDPASGRAGYTRRGEGSSRHAELTARFPAAQTEALTAVALLCRCLLREDPKESPVLDRAAATILQKPPAWNTATGAIDMYYWYYGSYALFQIGGSAWRDWQKKMNAAVLATQRDGGNADGSWDPLDAWGSDGGRVYATAMMVLCLEAYYRYARVLGGRG